MLRSQHRWQDIAAVTCAYAAAYVLFDYISYLKPYGNLGVTAWNPQMGLSLAFMFLVGERFSVPVLAAQLISDYVLRSGPLGLSVELATSLVSGSVAVLAALVLRSSPRFDPRLTSMRSVLQFVGVSAGFVAAGAVAYTVVLAVGGALGRGEFYAVVWRLFVGNLIGILVVVPCAFVFLNFGSWPKYGKDAILQLLAIVATLVVVFGYREATAFQLFYLLFLPLLWVALTYGTAGTAIALLVTQIGLVIGAEIRFGNDPGLTALQVLMITLSITGLLVGAVFMERENAAARIHEQQAALNRALRIRAAGEIAAGIAHEINQPLTAIRTYADVAAQALEKGDNSLLRQAVSKLSALSTRTGDIIRSIRELLHQGAVERKPTDLPALLQELMEIEKADLASSGLSISISVPQSLPSISVDGIQLVQALHNLVNNAADAMSGIGRDGTIDIDVTQLSPNSISIAVNDRGPGFPPGFDLENPTPFVSTKPHGAGIGLNIARNIAEAHGGKLVVRSSAQGAHVEIILPLMDLANG